MQEINKELYDQFFVKQLDLNEEVKATNIQTDDEHKFLFFFNKRKYKKVSLEACTLRFPRVIFINLVLH